MRRRIITLTAAYVALVVCATSGWHTLPPVIGLGVVLGFWAAGYRLPEYRLSDSDFEALLHG